jgi:hypothetical protein
MLDKVLRVFISLGGEADGEYYSPAFGIPQITKLAIPLEDLTHSNLTDCLELLVHVKLYPTCCAFSFFLL